MAYRTGFLPHPKNVVIVKTPQRRMVSWAPLNVPSVCAFPHVSLQYFLFAAYVCVLLVPQNSLYNSLHVLFRTSLCFTFFQ